MVSWRFALLALAAVAVVALAFHFWTGDERAIRKQLAVIEQLAGKEREEPPVEALVKATQLAALCHDPCAVRVEAIEHDGTYSRKQIADHIVLARGVFTRMRVSLHDIAIELPGDKGAVVRCTVRLNGEAKTDALADALELRAEMARIDGGWRFTAVTLVEVLER